MTEVTQHIQKLCSVFLQCHKKQLFLCKLTSENISKLGKQNKMQGRKLKPTTISSSKYLHFSAYLPKLFYIHVFFAMYSVSLRWY